MTCAWVVCLATGSWRLRIEGGEAGAPITTMLEVVRWSPVSREAVVAAGWGERASWYQNLRAAPAEEILIANERFIPVQRFLDLEERASKLCTPTGRNIR